MTKRYYATNEGMMPGYWKIVDTFTDLTVRSGIRNKEVAIEIAQHMNEVFERRLKRVS